MRHFNGGQGRGWVLAELSVLTATEAQKLYPGDRIPCLGGLIKLPASAVPSPHPLRTSVREHCLHPSEAS